MVEETNSKFETFAEKVGVVIDGYNLKLRAGRKNFASDQFAATPTGIGGIDDVVVDSIGVARRSIYAGQIHSLLGDIHCANEIAINGMITDVIVFQAAAAAS